LVENSERRRLLSHDDAAPVGGIGCTQSELSNSMKRSRRPMLGRLDRDDRQPGCKLPLALSRKHLSAACRKRTGRDRRCRVSTQPDSHRRSRRLSRRGALAMGGGGGHADNHLVHCMVMENGAPKPGRLRACGDPFVLAGAEDVERSTPGTSAAQGHRRADIVVKDALAKTAPPIFRAANALAASLSNVAAAVGPYVAAVALGIARGALDDLVALAGADKRPPAHTRLPTVLCSETALG